MIYEGWSHKLNLKIPVWHKLVVWKCFVRKEGKSKKLLNSSCLTTLFLLFNVLLNWLLLSKFKIYRAKRWMEKPSNAKNNIFISTKKYWKQFVVCGWGLDSRDVKLHQRPQGKLHDLGTSLFKQWVKHFPSCPIKY